MTRLDAAPVDSSTSPWAVVVLVLCLLAAAVGPTVLLTIEGPVRGRGSRHAQRAGVSSRFRS